MIEGGEMGIMIGTDLFLEDQEAGLIQGIVLAAVDVGVVGVGVTLAVKVMVAVVEDGLIT